jgi:hypothetical protein
VNTTTLSAITQCKNDKRIIGFEGIAIDKGTFPPETDYSTVESVLEDT